MQKTSILLYEDHIITLGKEVFTNFEKNIHDITWYYITPKIHTWLEVEISQIINEWLQDSHLVYSPIPLVFPSLK